MLEIQKGIFGNSSRITDRGTSFTSDEFKNYCNQEGIKHAKITAGLPRATMDKSKGLIGQLFRY